MRFYLNYQGGPLHVHVCMHQISFSLLFRTIPSISFPLPFQCLWLRTCLSLVLSLREALSLTSRDEKGGEEEEECPGRGRTSVLVQRVDEYKMSLEQMDGHMGMLYIREVLRQGSKVRGLLSRGGVISDSGDSDETHWVMTCSDFNTFSRK